MEKLDVNKILGRESIEQEIISVIQNIVSNNTQLNIKKGIYISGKPGVGKTRFITDLIKKINYDAIVYDAGDIRNKSVIETLTRDNMANNNILSMFNKKSKPIVVVMDEIDGMNSGDKGGINSLIKVIRPKKTKRQKTEEFTTNPIVCISNVHVDKKIRELMKVCHVFKLDTPSDSQITSMSKEYMPSVSNKTINGTVDYVQGDLRRLSFVFNIHDSNYNIFEQAITSGVLKNKSFAEDTRDVVKSLINKEHHFDDHSKVMNETDRTIVGLLWHENITDVLAKHDPHKMIHFYEKALSSLCYADYIDRVTFQRQIWQFNEMSSLIKTFSNTYLYHNTFDKHVKYNPSEVRFTKVLTKYSTEYNNAMFIQSISQQLGVDVKDMTAMFLHFRDVYELDDLVQLVERYGISKLDIVRLYRYLDKFTGTISGSDSDTEVTVNIS